MSHAENLPASQNPASAANEVTRDSTDVDCDHALSTLLRYCRSESWIGYDPYDGLKSPVARLFFFSNKFARTALTQLVKRCPINLRPILGIEKDLNPKDAAVSRGAMMMLSYLDGIQ